MIDIELIKTNGTFLRTGDESLGPYKVPSIPNEGETVFFKDRLYYVITRDWHFGLEGKVLVKVRIK